jgi:transcriptional regulator with XRE-family HTH domain
MFNYKRLRDLAHAKGVSNVELAKIIGKSRVSVSNYMHNKGYPSIVDIGKIAKHLGVSISYFDDEYELNIKYEDKDEKSDDTIIYLKALLESKDREIELLRKFYDEKK